MDALGASRSRAAKSKATTESGGSDDLREMAELLQEVLMAGSDSRHGTGERSAGQHQSPVELRQRLEQGARDLDLVADLEEIRLLLSSGGDDPTAKSHSPETMYAEAFRKYGIDLLVLDPAVAAARIRNSAVRETLLAFLHDWLYWISDADRARVQAVVDLADDDPWRRAFRDAIASRIRDPRRRRRWQSRRRPWRSRR